MKAFCKRIARSDLINSARGSGVFRRTFLAALACSEIRALNFAPALAAGSRFVAGPAGWAFLRSSIWAWYWSPFNQKNTAPTKQRMLIKAHVRVLRYISD